jgi:hypothetical protein
VSGPDVQGGELVREVFRRVREGDLAVADLFDEDADLYYHDVHAHGREAIRRFYRRTIDVMAPRCTVETLLETPPLYAAMIDLPTTKGHMKALDLFELGPGGVQRLEIYIRPKAVFP